MRPKKPETTGSSDLFQARLYQIIFPVSRSFPFALNRDRIPQAATLCADDGCPKKQKEGDIP
jgi:hypothetical protein